MDQSDAAPDVPATTGTTPAHNWTSYIPFVGH
jgi:hypothetical protein